jgi:hypothetical protein
MGRRGPPERVQRPRARRETFVEAVAGGLEPHRPQQDLLHGRLAAARAQRLLHVELVVVQQAQVELAVGGEAHAVAGAAVGLAHGRDEADHAAPVREAEVLRLVGGALGRQRLERAELALDPAPRLGGGDELRERHVRRLAASERHQLDEPDVPVAFERAAREVHDDRIVVIAGHGAIDLDRDEARLDRGRDAGLHLLDRGEAHQLLEPLGIERVKVDVEPLQARLAQRRGEAREQDSVGGHRHVAHTGDRRDAPGDLDDLGAQRRLAPGEAELPEADGHRGAHHRLDLPRGQKLGRGDEAQPPQRHAVDAAQVAVVDHREAQVVDLAGEAVARQEGPPSVQSTAGGPQNSAPEAALART